MAGFLYVLPGAGRGHGARHERHGHGGDDRTLGIYLWHGPGPGTHRDAGIPLPRRQCARHRVGRAGIRRRRLFRARRRQDRRRRPGLPLYPRRQSALHDSELELRHPGASRAGAGGRSPRSGRRTGRAVEPQRLRRGPQDGKPRRGHRRDPDRPYPRRPARGAGGKRDAISGVRFTRKIPVPPRYRGEGRQDDELQLPPDPGILRRHPAGSRGRGHREGHSRAA